MNKLLFTFCFLVNLSILPSEEIIVSSANSLNVITEVQQFLDQFQVFPRYQETKEDFKNRLEKEDQFTLIIFGSDLNISSNLNNDELTLFKRGLVACKNYGFWGGGEDGFYVSSKIKLRHELANFTEFGNYSWRIDFLSHLDDEAFENTPIQKLIQLLLREKHKKILIPFKDVFIEFEKNNKTIVSHLNYNQKNNNNNLTKSREENY